MMGKGKGEGRREEGYDLREEGRRDIDITVRFYSMGMNPFLMTSSASATSSWCCILAP